MPDEEKDDQNTGEDTQDDKGGEGEFDADAHDLMLDDGEEGGDTPDKEETGDDDKKDEEPNELDQVKATLAEREAHIKNLNKALHEARQDRKKGKDEGDTKGEAPLTKEQLLAIMKEHKDDPAVMLNVIEYAAQQAGKAAEKKAVDAVELSSKKKELDDYLSKNYPTLSDESSEDRASLEKVKAQLAVDDHPFGDFMAVAVRTQLMLPAILQAAVEQGKKEALGKNADDKRKANVKSNAPAPAGKGSAASGTPKGKAGLSGDAADVAKRIGLSQKGQAIYSKLLQGSKKSVSVED